MLDEEKRGTRRKEGRGGSRYGEEGDTRRKEGREGRWDGEVGGTRRVKNEKVAKKGKMKKSLKDASLASLGLVNDLLGVYGVIW